jgi:hypothetical protein
MMKILNKVREWMPTLWMIFAIYSLTTGNYIGILFSLFMIIFNILDLIRSEIKSINSKL